jgi:hypothetical protein
MQSTSSSKKSVSESPSTKPSVSASQRFEPMATALSRAEARFEAAQKARRERLAHNRQITKNDDDEDDVLIA